jgi:predicted metal-dependent hydrolase
MSAAGITVVPTGLLVNGRREVMVRRTRRPAADQPALLEQAAGQESELLTEPTLAPQPAVVVRRSARRKRTVTAYRDADTIVVLIPQRMTKADERVYVDEMVAKVLARESRSGAPRGDTALAQRAAELSELYLVPQLGYPPRPTSVNWVRNQNHRWGSCTPSSGTIRLSHRMQTMPSWVVDYVLLHELAHLVEAAHSRRFWRLVNVYPQSEKAQGYLEGFQAATQGRSAAVPDGVLE